jgi:hypothetical protein
LYLLHVELDHLCQHFHVVLHITSSRFSFSPCPTPPSPVHPVKGLGKPERDGILWGASFLYYIMLRFDVEPDDDDNKVKDGGKEADDDFDGFHD